MTCSRAAALPQTLALALAVLFASACSPAPPGTTNAPQAAAPAAAASDDTDNPDDGEAGNGTLRFQLEPDTTLSLPITLCAGAGKLLTVVGSEGTAQVDLRVVELPAMRDGAPLKDVTDAGYRFDGSDQGRGFQEVWQSRSIDEVVRDGNATQVRGSMYGLRMYDKGNGTYTTPEAINGGAELAFRLEVTCSE